MAIHTIKVPDIGEGIAEVELVQWHVGPGDQVSEDQILAEVMTDKATVEVPSPIIGKVVSLGAQVGQLIAVGSKLISLEVGGGLQKAPDPAETTLTSAQTALSPLAGQQAKAEDSGLLGGKPLASPSVRRHARELGLELRSVKGSGPGGRITHDDLQSRSVGGGHIAATLSGAAGYAPRDQTTDIPVIGVRRKIAEKMQESKRHIPHVTYVEEIDVTELELLRVRLNAQWESERGRLTLLPFLVRAIVLAVAEFPQVNARFDDNAFVVTHYSAVHIGIATQTEGGLKVPVLYHAETLDLWSAATEVARLAELTRDGKAKRDELAGSTITITSLGALGGIVSTPIINYPEVAIVGVNRIVERPMIYNGAVIARKMMNLSSSFDHRLIDGLLAAQFIQKIKGYLECPAMLFIA
ncbi:MAG TPA: dihydrolipoamide acetyltransferase family protein [Eoetvoesiella sp.]